MIRIAIPTSNSKLHGHFGGCREFTLVQADPVQRQILSTQSLTPPPHVPGLFPRWLREQGANVVIVGGIGQRALAVLAQHDIAVLAGTPDASVKDLVNAYLNGQLTTPPNGCTHHEHHDHNHDHGCHPE